MAKKWCQADEYWPLSLSGVINFKFTLQDSHQEDNITQYEEQFSFSYLTQMKDEAAYR